MKILLINPPSPFLIDQKAFPPLSVLYIAAYLRAYGFDVEVKDMQDTNIPNALSDTEAEICGISATTPQYLYAKEIMQFVNDLDYGKLIVIGGPHASSAPEQCKSDGFDVVVQGEGEKAMTMIATKYQKSERLYRVIEAPYIADIDTIPFPARDLIDLKSYGYEIDGGNATTIITSRGCPYNCAFCSKDVWQHRVRFHSPEYVYNELELVQDTYGFDNFLFLDDSLGFDKKRLVKICDLITPLNLKWRCYMRSNNVTADMIKAMKKAGCVEIGMGVESGSQKILDIVDKKTTVVQNTKMVQMCKAEGIVANVFIMIGLPGETPATVAATKRWMEEVKPDKFGFNIFMPYVGTPIYNNPNHYDIQIHPIDESKMWVKGRQGEYSAFVSTAALTKEEILQQFHELFDYYTKLTNWQPGIGGKKVLYDGDG